MLTASLLALCLGGLHCSSRSEGMAVEVGVMHRLGHDAPLDAVAPQPAGRERGLVNDLAYGITLRRALVVIGSLELRPCEPTALQRLRGFLSPVRTARAHGPSSPRVLAVPHVVDLMQEDERTLTLARMAPPPGDYCGVRVEIRAADADAEGLPPDVELIDRSVYLEGTYVPPDAAHEAPFSLRSDVREEVELPFVGEDGASRRLLLSPQRPMAELRFELGYGRMFDGVDLGGEDPDLAGFLVIQNLLGSARAVVP